MTASDRCKQRRNFDIYTGGNGMERFTLAQAAEWTKGETAGDAVLTAVSTDSRRIPQEALFLPLAGERFDGHDFIGKALENGAAAVMSHRACEEYPVPALYVGNTSQALLDLAGGYRMMCGGSVVGVTGSVGKTTTKELLYAVLAQQFRAEKTEGNLNNEIGLPLTSLKVNAGTRFLVAEMGANHVGEIANLTSLVPPDIAVVLKVGVAHLGEFGSAERIAQAKSEIVRGLVPGGLTILNANDEHVAAMSAIAPADVLWFGLPQKEDAQLDTTALDVRCDDLDHPSFVLEDKTGRHANVTLGICGQHNVMNALAAATVAMTLGMPIDDVASGLSDVTSISPHRMAVSTVTKPETSFTLIDDSFNANPDSMKAGLDGLSRWHAGAEQQPFRIAVLGAMLELGPDEHRLHEDVGRYAVEGGADALVTVGSTSDEALDALAEAMAQGGKAVAADPTMVQWAHDAEQADRMVTRLATDHEGTVVLLKGSHASGLLSLIHI